jgi:Flp pilus assembly pilin Flp
MKSPKRAQMLSEYALIIALVAAAVIAGLSQLALGIEVALDNVGDALGN